jgi:hypothetical protein
MLERTGTSVFHVLARGISPSQHGYLHRAKQQIKPDIGLTNLTQAWKKT